MVEGLLSAPQTKHDSTEVSWRQHPTPWATHEQNKVQWAGWKPQKRTQAASTHGQQQQTSMLVRQHARPACTHRLNAFVWCNSWAQWHELCENWDGVPRPRPTRYSMDEHSLSSKALWDACTQHAHELTIDATTTFDSCAGGHEHKQLGCMARAGLTQGKCGWT